MLKEYLNSNYGAITILGPTASGKTKAAVALAHKIERLAGKKAEILSADSRQVYIGMDIGTGKDIVEYGDVPVHLIDIVPAGEKYNIFRYQRDFSKAYSQIIERGNYPIICGGSGLYIEAATCGYELKEVEPNLALRAELEHKTMEELIAMFTDLKLKNGSQPHNNTDFDTKKRVIRAIEIELEVAKKEIKNKPLPLPDKNSVLFLGVDVDRETRNKRIDTRLQSRLEEGMIDEVKRLLDSGIKAEDLIYYGLEYKYVTLYLTGELEYSVMVEKLQTAIHQFAKRQMTWFRGMERKGIEIKWLPLEEFLGE